MHNIYMTYDYDNYLKEKLIFIAQHSQRILDVGGGHPFQKTLSQYESLMKGKEYITLDIDPKTNPTVVGDAHHIPFPDASFDAVTHVYVLEHVHTPQRVIDEIYRVLKPGGYMIGVVPFLHPYHAKRDSYSDYWRFSKDGLAFLCREFSEFELFKIGRYFMAAIGFIPFLWRIKHYLELIAYILDRILISDSRNTTAGFIIFTKK